MSTATKTSEDPFIINDDVVAHRLNFARQKLLTEEISLQLRAISYLQICCLAIQQLRQELWLFKSDDTQEQECATSYVNLLKSLNDRHPDWWKQCEVSNRGVLKSNDSVIDRLLQPLAYFIESYSDQPQNQRRDYVEVAIFRKRSQVSPSTQVLCTIAS